MYFDDFSKIGFSTPSLPEQEKIASFLSAVDTKIAQLTRKKELLEQYKKGVMQNIFSQEIRFKDDNGHDYPNWEEKRLGEIAKFQKGRNIGKEDITTDGQHECIRYGELYTHYRERIDNVISKTNIPLKLLEISHENDVLIPSSGETHIDF